MTAFTMQDLRVRCAWAGLADTVPDLLVAHYGADRLDALVDAVWIVGLHMRTHGALPPGKTLGERARSAAASMPEAQGRWGDLP